jgi:molecular chaperone DnaK
MSSYMEFGIDLGTTNSCIGRCEGDTVRIFQNDDLMNVTPSAVRIIKSGRMIVGKKAYNALADDPENVATEFKRAMGNKEPKRFPATGRELSPEQLSAEILKALRDDVRRAIGRDVTGAVVTVPAAFGTLQCDATARAGTLAGIPNGTLLQEPIAAAVAYGVAPGSKDQYWLVYDLGGGTLDIAVISTRDGRLTVLEHRGDNLLGGKDIDRALVETFLLPALKEQFSLVSAESHPQEFQNLFRRLTIKAEEAKIELSTRAEVVVSIFDMGEDTVGRPIEMEIPLRRVDLERIVDPILQRTLRLADEALVGARMQGKDLSKILLVGGPTQMPYVRAALTEHLNAPVDHSLDPMTVVAKGAAIFAATVEVPETSHPVPAAPDAVTLKLAYEPVSSATETVVAGKILNDAGAQGLELRIASQAGYWDSGWLQAKDGFFEVRVVLQQGKICPFHVYARDASGTTLQVEPSDFTIRHGLELSAPPLPHTISIEVERPNGRAELDPIFPRRTPLPAEARKSYRAAHTLRPAESGGSLAVKLWEGEEFQEPEANEWVGNVRITSSMIRRPIPENSEMELYIRIDTSRLMTLDIFVPYLNEHFSESVYLAEQEQRSDKDATVKLTNEIVGFTERLAALEGHLKSHPNPESEETLIRFQREVVDLDIELAHFAQQPGGDPDQIRRLVAKARDLRTQISTLEQRVGLDRFLDRSTKHAQATLDRVGGIVEQFGGELDRYEFERRRKELEAAAARLDDRSVRKCITELSEFSFGILSRHDWFWRDVFESMDKGDGAFTNPSAAQKWVQEGERAIREGNSENLRHAVRELWRLMPIGAAQEARDRATKSGVRT